MNELKDNIYNILRYNGVNDYYKSFSQTDFSEIKKYISKMDSIEKKYELLEIIGDDIIQNYLRTKKINRIIKR